MRLSSRTACDLLLPESRRLNIFLRQLWTACKPSDCHLGYRVSLRQDDIERAQIDHFERYVTIPPCVNCGRGEMNNQASPRPSTLTVDKADEFWILQWCADHFLRLP